MSSRSLQRLSTRGFSAFRRLRAGLRRWIQRRPKLAAWIYPDEDRWSEEDRRDYNGQMFANFHEHERMLSDRPRMDFYHAAISRHIQPGDRVVDLGTGTGILAALAARRGAAHVYAIDHSEILTHARTLAAANRVERVEFVAMHSSAFTVDRCVDVILHEQMGDCLFDESMVANIIDLRDRVLKPGGLILPSLFDFYCEPIKIRDGRVVPFIWELTVQGYEYACLERHRPQDMSYYHLTSTDRSLVEHFLGDPEPALSFDLQTITDADLPLDLNFTRTVIHPGRMDGYAVYFRARVDRDLELGSSPLDPGRAPHWGFRVLRTDRRSYERGDRIDIRLQVGRWADLNSWRWSQMKRSEPKPGLAEKV